MPPRALPALRRRDHTGPWWRWAKQLGRCRRIRSRRRRCERSSASRAAGTTGETRSRGHSGSCSRSALRCAVVLDDIQWGDETFLDLVESTALLSAGAPMLPPVHGASGAAGAAAPLAGVVAARAAARRARVEALIGDGVLGRAAEAGLRPRRKTLFVSEMLGDGGRRRPGRGAADAAGAVDGPARPAGRAERRVLERGAVEGEIFHRGAVRRSRPRSCR